MSDQKITVTDPATGQRLDKFLTSQLKSISRSQIQKLIKANLVKVNNQKTTVHYFLKAGDQITLEKTDKPPVKIQKPKIIFENDDYLVINKPSGLLVHPTENIKTGTLVDFLIERYPTIKKVGGNPKRPGIVHRLDRDVSGLMIIAKNQKTFDHLKKQFQDRRVTKIYTALVYGGLEKDSGTIDFPIARSKTDRRLMAARPRSQGGREAVSKYEVIKRFKNYTLVKVQILTGRPHQIRVHFKGLGYPVVGDKIYKTRKLKIKEEPERIFLHSSHLAFRDLNGQTLEFNSALPKSLRDYLKQIS